jgi:ribosome-binding factor A
MSRIERVEEEIRQQVSMIIQRDLHDPRIGFVTVIRVQASPDLKTANVYFTTIEKNKSFEDTVAALEQASGYVRRLIGERIKIKFTPKINFVYDDTQAEQNRIDELLDRIHKETKEDGDRKDNKDI